MYAVVLRAACVRRLLFSAPIFFRFSFLFSLVISSRLLGAEVGGTQASAAVRGWLRANARPLGEALGTSVKDVQVFTNETGEPLYHVVALEPSGFVVVAAEDLVEPIIAFSSRGRFDPSPGNPLAALVSRDLPGRVAQARGLSGSNPVGGFLHARTKWQRLSVSSEAAIPAGSASVSDVRVAPFVQSRWNQQTSANGKACYNYYVPPNAYGSAANYPCGCVATAVAQLMRYYQYPTAAVGTGSYTISFNGTNQSVSLLGGDGAGGPYDWADMVPVASSPTLVQCQAIGALTHDIGAAVNMQYASGGSAASLSTAKRQLLSTFKYTGGIDGYNYSWTTIGTGLTNMINPNLDARMPVVLGIEGSAGGHAVVCDGYGFSLSTLYHHLNLGWGGNSDAWYALPLVNTSAYVFTNFNECLYNIYTNGSGEIVSGRVMDSNGSPLAGATVSAMQSGAVIRAAATDTNGIFAITRLASANSYIFSATKPGYATNSAVFSTGTSSNGKVTSGNYWGANFTLTSLPTVLASAWSPSGMTLTFNAVAGTNLIQASTNLVNWTTLAAITNSSGTVSYTDPLSTSYPRRFYRCVRMQ